MMELTPVMRKFILFWGEMGSTWGLNRTVAQIYAMLYLAPEPMTAEEISEVLAIARSTVSTGLRELQVWGVVKTISQLGDRRDHFTTMNDLWEIFRAILNERKRREIDPALEILRESVADLENSEPHHPHVEERLMDMLEFLESVNTVYNQFEMIPTDQLKKYAQMGENVVQVLSRVTPG